MGDKKDDQLLIISEYLHHLKDSWNLRVENERVQKIVKDVTGYSIFGKKEEFSLLSFLTISFQQIWSHEITCDPRLSFSN